MAHEKYIDLIAKYLSGNISAAEKTELLQWTESAPENRQFFEEMVQLWGLADRYEEEVFEADTAKAWEIIDRRTGGERPTSASGGSARIIPSSMRSTLLRVAAVTILLVAASYGVYSVWNSLNEPAPIEYVVESTTAEERREITLPDGSQVWLNERTSISYAEDFQERTVELEGEAFFDVAYREDSPFVIISGEAQTTVLGTAFNVRAYPGEETVEVTVQRGKVALGKKSAVTPQPADPVVLEAGVTGVFNRPEAKVAKVEEQLVNADAWKTGLLKLDGLAMEQIITVLERYYDVDIEAADPDILNCTATFLTYEREPLDTVLKGLTYMMNLTVERQPSDSTIVLKGNGCPR